MGLGLEILKNTILNVFWSDFLILGLEIFKNTILKAFWSDFLTLGLEILKNSFLKAFWTDFCAWAWKCLKIVPGRLLDGPGQITSWKPSGSTFEPGPGNF